MWHFVGKGPIWSFLETEILKKIGEIVKKKNDFPHFGVLGHQKHPISWQSTEKVTPRFTLNFSWQ